jgi:hypothetical protein
VSRTVTQYNTRGTSLLFSKHDKACRSSYVPLLFTLGKSRTTPPLASQSPKSIGGRLTQTCRLDKLLVRALLANPLHSISAFARQACSLNSNHGGSPLTTASLQGLDWHHSNKTAATFRFLASSSISAANGVIITSARLHPSDGRCNQPHCKLQLLRGRRGNLQSTGARHSNGKEEASATD